MVLAEDIVLGQERRSDHAGHTEGQGKCGVPRVCGAGAAFLLFGADATRSIRHPTAEQTAIATTLRQAADRTDHWLTFLHLSSTCLQRLQLRESARMLWLLFQETRSKTISTPHLFPSPSAGLRTHDFKKARARVGSALLASTGPRPRSVRAEHTLQFSRVPFLSPVTAAGFRRLPCASVGSLVVLGPSSLSEKAEFYRSPLPVERFPAFTW